jgi:hypothetical protein
MTPMSMDFMGLQLPLVGDQPVFDALGRGAAPFDPDPRGSSPGEKKSSSSGDEPLERVWRLLNDVESGKTMRAFGSDSGPVSGDPHSSHPLSLSEESMAPSAVGDETVDVSRMLPP